MARGFTIKILMDLAKSIGANPSKFMGTRTNVNFLGTGPTKHSLFQKYLPLRAETPVESLGRPESLINAVENAMGYATAGKLNGIQTEILGQNLLGLKNIIKPPPLPSASVSRFPGITGLPKGISQGDALYASRTGGIKSRLPQSRLPEPGPGDVDQYMGVLNIKTGMSRAIARNLLLKDTRLKLKPEDLFMLKEGKGEPLDLMQKYYGRSMSAYDDFLNQVNLEAARPDEFAEMILKNVKLIPEFAEGGLARILEV